ncbi:MAG: RNA-binding protein [Candidatus Ratteibacteria bacterium]|nr:RNA-binding protein [Candidatus Ratteibacteria bacterium]
MEQKHKLYVGNLNYDTTEEELKNLFSEKGIETISVVLITDKYTGRPKGFGFVEVQSEAVLQQAVDALNGQELNGRKLTVNKANPPRERTGHSGFKDRGGFGGGRKGGFNRDRRSRY